MKFRYLLSVLSISLLMLSCKGQTAPSGLINEDINTADFAAALDTVKNALLLDVRSDNEFVEQHLRGAVQLDFYGDDFEEKLAELDVNQPVLVYCRSGNRSGKTAKKLKELGVRRVYNLEGGILAWMHDNRPVQK